MPKKLSEQVAELEDKLQREEAEAIFWERQYRESQDHWENSVDELKRKCDRLRAENADLRAGRGRWPKVEDAAKAEPEIVTAETIRASEVWSTWRDSRDKGTWQWEGDDRFCYHPDNGDASRLFTPENAVRRYGPLAAAGFRVEGDDDAT